MDIDRRIQRRLQNSLDRLADIDAELCQLVPYSEVGKHILRLTEEYAEIKDALRLYDIPVGTTLSSRDGALTLGCHNGPRVLDIPRYRRSAVGDILAKEHPEVLVPEGPDIAARALGSSIDGYYISRPVVKIMDGGRYRRMMDIISEIMQEG